MPNITIDLNKSQLRRIESLLSNVKNGSARALQRTNKNTVNHAKTESSKVIRDDIALNKTFVDKKFKIKLPTFQNSTAVLSIPQQGLLWAFFKINPLKRGGVSAKLWKSGKPVQIKTAYVVKRLRYTKTPSGAPAVEKRTISDPAKPSDWLYGPSPSQVFAENVEEDKFRQDLNDFQQRTLQSEVKFILSKV